MSRTPPVRAAAVAAIAALWLAVAPDAARAQFETWGTSEAPAAISLGGRGWGAREGGDKRPAADRPPASLEFSAKAGVASDYIYRGTTLSDRKPAAGAGIEATIATLYAGMSVASVKLPSNPNAEITFSGGIRPSIGNVDFDFGAVYFHYPGETPGSPGIDYWETSARADTKLTESILAAGGFAYSPDVSNTGAWGWYAAAGLGYEVPALKLLPSVSILATAAAGYSWFGHQSAALGGFALPNYLNWQAGVTFTHKALNLDLRYYDTNLSKEDCYVFTGDPNASPGGRINPINNPDGLVSRWCNATFVAKLWLAFN